MAAAIMNAFGASAILAGAWVQARNAYKQHVRHQERGDIMAWVSPHGYLSPRLTWGPLSPEAATESIFAI